MMHHDYSVDQADVILVMKERRRVPNMKSSFQGGRIEAIL